MLALFALNDKLHEWISRQKPSDPKLFSPNPRDLSSKFSNFDKFSFNLFSSYLKSNYFLRHIMYCRVEHGFRWCACMCVHKLTVLFLYLKLFITYFQMHTRIHKNIFLFNFIYFCPESKIWNLKHAEICDEVTQWNLWASCVCAQLWLDTKQG